MDNLCGLSAGQNSSVGIATRYGLDGPGDRIPVWTRFSTYVQNGSRALTVAVWR